MSWKITLQVVTDPQQFHVIRKMVSAMARALGASPSTSGDIELGVGEAMANAHLHAYGGRPGPMEVDLESDGLILIITIHDDGEPVTAKPTIPDHLPPPRGEGGRGLYLIRRVMDEAEVLHPRPSGRGTAIRMAKHLR